MHTHSLTGVLLRPRVPLPVQPKCIFFFIFIIDILIVQPVPLSELQPINICLLFFASISLHPSISDHFQYSLSTLILIFGHLFFFWLPRKYFLYGPIIRLSYYMTSPFSSSYFNVDIWFSIHNLQFIVSSDFPANLICYWAIYLFIFHSHVSRNDFITSVIVHISQPYKTTGLI